jgi:hypothetical protein
MMAFILLVVLLVIVIAVFTVLLWRYKSLLGQLQALRKESGLEQSETLLPYMKLVLKNPQAIAEKESKLAKAVAAVTPEYLKFRVYKQVASELEKALNDRDIDVSIELVGLKAERKIGAEDGHSETQGQTQ